MRPGCVGLMPKPVILLKRCQTAWLVGSMRSFSRRRKLRLAGSCAWSRVTLRIYILKVQGTLTSALGHADKLRLRLRSEPLLTLLWEQ